MEGADHQLQQHQFQDFYNLHFSFEAPLSCDVPTTQDCNSSFSNVLSESSYIANTMANIPESNEYLWPPWIHTSINILDSRFKQLSGNHFPPGKMMYEYSNYMNEPTQNYNPQNFLDLLQTPPNNFFSGRHNPLTQPQYMTEAAAYSIHQNPPTRALSGEPIRCGRSIIYPSVIVPRSNISSSLGLEAVDPSNMSWWELKPAESS